jgi:hypothetical protein
MSLFDIRGAIRESNVAAPFRVRRDAKAKACDDKNILLPGHLDVQSLS